MRSFDSSETDEEEVDDLDPWRESKVSGGTPLRG
jgi:hypothetical protein